MAIDPNIALAVKPVELADPLAQYGKIAAIQSAANQNELAQYQLSSAKRADEAATIKNELLAKHYNPQTGMLDMNAFAQEAAQRKQGALIPEAAKAEAARQKEAAELKLKQDEVNRAMYGNLAMNPSDENVKAHLQDLVIQNQITPEKANERWAHVAGMSLPQRADFFNKGAQTAHQRVGHEVTIRGQDLVNQRGLEANKIARERETRLAAGGDLKPVPVHAQKAITGAASTLGQLDKAIAELEANPDAVGWKGLTPDIALNRLNPEGTQARASLADIGSLKIHERSGAAVTASETPRLKPFIPSISDDYDTALTKLKRMRDIQAAEQEVLTGTYNREQGFRDFTSPQPTPAAPAKPAETPAKPAAPAASNVVQLPNGSSMTFPDAKSAAAFKKKAGL